MGMNCSCSNVCDSTPMMNPNRLNVTEIINRKPTTASGCVTSKGTNSAAVANVIAPTTKDFVAAAPT